MIIDMTMIIMCAIICFTIVVVVNIAAKSNDRYAEGFNDGMKEVLDDISRNLKEKVEKDDGNNM